MHRANPNPSASATLAPNRRQERSNQARVKLSALIDEVPIGEALPTIASLQEHCGVGRRVVDTLVGEMAEEGVLKRAPGQGIFKLRDRVAPVAAGSGVVEVIACGRQSDVHQSLFLDEMIRCLAAQAGDRDLHVRLRQVADTEPPSAYEKLADVPRSDFILLGAHFEGLLELFIRRGHAAVGLLPRYPQRCGPTIQPAGGLTRAQFQHLYDLGHRRIAMLDPLDPAAPSWTMIRRREAYFRQMARHGLPVGERWTPWHGHTPRQTLVGLRRMFAVEPTPTALIVPDRVLPVLYAFLRGEGLEPGRDVSIIATDDLSVTAQVEPNASSTRFSRNVAAQRTLATLAEVRARQTQDRTVLLPITLTRRGSTQPPE